ncbi:MAG: hypothetical protein FJ098_03655, partial [Deltaproteobacteria bacterium]|nr:hypothetical protein [Deltaproteobacteria bacterium]
MDKGLNPGRSGFPEGLPSAAPEAPPRRRIRGLAVATAVLCIAGHLARGIGGSGVTPGEGPVGQVVAQALWNAAQVGQLLLILSLWSVRRGWLIGLLALATVGLLPFSSYLIGPGGHASTALMLVTCALALRRGRPELEVRITDPVPGRSSGFRFEALAFLCNLLCSLYNYNASWLCWPHWDSLFRRAEGALHITAEPSDVAARLYSMGLPGVELPAYVPSATGSTLGALIFALIWTVLP